HRLVTRYHYDTQHRLSQVTLPNLSTVRYRYDAFGRRISKDIGGYLTTFIWQANRLIAETDDFSHYRSYLYEPGTYRPLAQLEGEGNLAQVYYYHLDHLGTPQEMTAANGERVWSVQYKAYGHVKRTLIEKVDTNLRFQGQYYDGETGLHYNRHRYYHPGTGHFLTPDPIKLAGGLNHYQYVPNPVNWVDPLGLTSVPGECPKKDSTGTSKTQRQDEGPEAPEAGLRPEDFGLETISDNPRAHQLWEQAMKDSVNKAGYKDYLDTLEKGLTPTKEQANAAFVSVRATFDRLAKKEGLLEKGDEIHHWNYSKGHYPLQVVDPRNLVIAIKKDGKTSRAVHTEMHRATTSNDSDIWTGPIDEKHKLEIDDSYYPLADPEE
ncbi:RHS repeat domain-containing protein, partial [Pokkaliibacter plantistimulans]